MQNGQVKKNERLQISNHIICNSRVLRPSDNDFEEVRQMKEYIVTEHPGFPYEEPNPQELIRCKDCKFADVYYHGFQATDMFTRVCKKLARHVETDEFCAWAERKES